ncbi:MAG: beta-ketoacyl-[acyl-carrier-protein] synthase II [Tenericutes bacterium HGW-Tenericutes-1]|jgi:3-oxoacyl-[acyl-carrier-protein] synthase II|nr:MAG: beta-ketoacyl-[acyl-carrier-protein] synthase II [Tenericutes bacterium HGW-Tenericutes-3]PKL00893.1 MAG: beta-ketoacyl-[acyl-carrier-protein] synthase II [Tenericutes bacterium HGW-Tenericutes-1]
MKRRVVITGMGAITSVGNNVSDTWNALAEGKNGIDFITLFDVENSKVKIAGEVKNFDPLKVINPREARKLDRVIQLAICASQEAYDQAKLTKESVDPYRFGTFVTSGIGGLNTIWEESSVACLKGMDRMSPFFIPNSIVNLIGGHIAIRFQAKGPNLPVVTACSAGTNSIGEAFRYIRDGYLDVAFAGGSEAPINVLGVGGFASMRALSPNNEPNNSSMPFDLNRNGFVIAEGSGVFILEDYDHAKARNATIIAEVVGYGSTSDAFHMTAPDESAEGINVCMRLAMEDAKIKPEEIGYINAHGTSTSLNDKIETLGFKKAFGDYANKVSISSTKSMTGHALGATGAIESIICVEAIRHGIVPPTINYKTPDPECDLDYTPNVAKKRDLKYAMNVNLGFGGQNAALIFKRYEEEQ